jgi:hypothetical protein
VAGADQFVTTATLPDPVEYLLLEDGSDVLQEDGASRLRLNVLAGTAVVFPPTVQLPAVRTVTTAHIASTAGLWPPTAVDELSLKATFLCAHLSVEAATVAMTSWTPRVAVAELVSPMATGLTSTARVAIADLTSPLVVLGPTHHGVDVLAVAMSATAVLGPTRAGEASTDLVGATVVAGPSLGGADIAELVGATADLRIKEC